MSNEEAVLVFHHTCSCIFCCIFYSETPFSGKWILMRTSALNSRLLSLFVVTLLTACQDHDNREYMQWGEAGENVTERLRDNRIDYKVEDGDVYIPRDQYMKATACCT